MALVVAGLGDIGIHLAELQSTDLDLVSPIGGSSISVFRSEVGADSRLLVKVAEFTAGRAFSAKFIKVAFSFTFFAVIFPVKKK